MGQLRRAVDEADAKMTVFGGQEPVGAEGDAWERAKATFRRLNAAPAYLFSVPMWNASVPYILKQLIDVVSQPGMMFGFDPEAGYTGLLENKRAVVMYTSAVYGPDRPASFGTDFQAPYFNDWLQWAGIKDAETIEFRPNLVLADADSARREAHCAAVRLARRF